MKRELSLFVLLFIGIFLVLSCGGVDDNIGNLSDILSGKDFNEALVILLDMDQKNPEDIGVKANLAALYLQVGEGDKARIYLDSARNVLKKNPKRGSVRDRYLLWSNASVLEMVSGNNKDAIQFADFALSVDDSDPVGAELTKAQALLSIKKYNEAAEIFTEFWNVRRNTMSSIDCLAFAGLLIQGEEFEDALLIFDYVETTFGYHPGTGIRQSVVLENLGRYEESIFSVFKDLDIQRFFGLADSELIKSNLVSVVSSLHGKIDDRRISNIEIIVRGVGFYIDARYSEAAELLSPFQDQIDNSYFTFVLLSSRLESGTSGVEDFGKFIEYEKVLVRHPGFYYHLWKGMKAGEGKYSFQTARSLLEQVIILAPNTRFALESRIELAYFFGISKDNLLLIGPELESVYNIIRNTSSFSEMEKIIAMLDLSDNPYSATALLLLEDLSMDQSVRQYLRDSMNSRSASLIKKLSPFAGI